MQEIDEALEADLDYLFLATSTDRERCAAVATTFARMTATPGSSPSTSSAVPSLAEAADIVPSPVSERGRNRSLARRRVRPPRARLGAGLRDRVPALAAREALLVGASSGGVAAAIESLASKLAPASRCAAIFPDGGAGYLDTAFDDEWVERELGSAPDELAAMVAGL